MSGIASARALQAAGLPVRLIDKGLVFLGKKALRRAAVAGEGLTFDHDVQSLDRRQLAESVTALGQEALDTWYLSDGTSRTVGLPSMAALPKALTHDPADGCRNCHA